MVTANKREKRLLEKSNLETTAGVIRLGNPSVQIERALSLSAPPSFWEPCKSVKSDEARFGMGDPFEPIE